MAVQSIDNVLVRQFQDSLHIEAQQMMAKTMPFVMFKTMEGDDLAYDGFGKVRSQQVQSRNQKIEFSDAEFTRRKLARERHIVAVPIDASDVRGMLLDPTGPITKACMAELNRVKDRIVVREALADVLTGRNFGTTVTFASDGGATVDATAGFTYEKLLEIRRNFKKRNIDISQIALLITDQEEEALFRETELTSGDFTRIMPIDRGDMMQALGMQLVTFGSDPLEDDPILNVVSTTRDNIAIAMTPERSGICMGMSKDITVRIQERTDLIETTQVVVTMEVGAVRTEGVLVQRVQTTTT